MGTMFTMIFAFITRLFSAAEKTASALDNLAGWADDASGTFADVARHERQMKINTMMKEAGITELPKAAPRKTIAAPKTA